MIGLRGGTYDHHICQFSADVATSKQSPALDRPLFLSSGLLLLLSRQSSFCSQAIALGKSRHVQLD